MEKDTQLPCRDLDQPGPPHLSSGWIVEFDLPTSPVVCTATHKRGRGRRRGSDRNGSGKDAWMREGHTPPSSLD